MGLDPSIPPKGPVFALGECGRAPLAPLYSITSVGV